MKVPLQLRQTPNLGAVDPQIGLHLGRRRSHSGNLNPQQLGAPLQWGRNRPGEGLVLGLPSLHTG
jgi:hypothetical protein